MWTIIKQMSRGLFKLFSPAIYFPQPCDLPRPTRLSLWLTSTQRPTDVGMSLSPESRGSFLRSWDDQASTSSPNGLIASFLHCIYCLFIPFCLEKPTRLFLSLRGLITHSLRFKNQETPNLEPLRISFPIPTMTTHAWKQFIHSWHTLGVVLKWMCMVVIGIPFAIATCLLVAAAALIFFALCFLAAFAACALVYYILKGLWVGSVMAIQFFKQWKQGGTLPITRPKRQDGNGKGWVLPLRTWVKAVGTNKGSSSTEPQGYVYPWYEENLRSPPVAHLSLDENESPTGTASQVLASNLDAITPVDSSSLENPERSI